MNLVELIDMAQTVADDVNPNDVVMRINAAYSDLASDVDCEFATALVTLAEPQRDFVWSDFDPVDPAEEPVSGRLRKLMGVSLGDVAIRHVNNAAVGDLAFIENDGGFRAGQYLGKNNADLSFSTLPAGAEVGIYYAKAPQVSLATGSLPLPEFHAALVYKLRSDLHADRSEWDRVGYYLRRYRESFDKAKRALRANRGTWNIPNVRI